MRPFARPVGRPPVIERASAELRYSLRSVAAHLNVGEVHLFGGSPAWLSDQATVHRVGQAGAKHDNTWRLWGAIADACAHKELPDRFLLMMDDLFAMQPIRDVPAMVRGTAAQWAADRRSGLRSSPLARAMDATIATVAGLAGPSADEQLCYELHVPLPIDRRALAGMWPDLARAWARHGRLIKRTAYGNLAGLNRHAETADDVKVRGIGDPPPAGPWWSTSDAVFAASNRGVGRAIRAAFPSRSRFEAS